MVRDHQALGLPVTRDGARALAEIVVDPRGALVASDFDGTLAAIVGEPSDARPAPGAVDALQALSARVGQVALVTGRPAQVAVDLGGLDQVERIVVLGLYGAERWQDGVLVPAEAPPGLEDARVETERLVAAYAGCAIEDKGASFAVHARNTADPAATTDALRSELIALASRHGLRVATGRYVLELHGLRHDKGGALDELITETASRSVVFCGDDVGDLAAFTTVRRRRAAGIPGLTVASTSSEAPSVAEDADLVVDGPEGVVTLLRRLGTAIDEAAGR